MLGEEPLLQKLGLVGHVSFIMDDAAQKRQRTAVTSPDTEDDLADVYTSDFTSRLPPSTAHPRLKTIRTCDTQHLVDSYNMVWMGSNPEMKGFLATRFYKISL